MLDGILTDRLIKLKQKKQTIMENYRKTWYSNILYMEKNKNK